MRFPGRVLFQLCTILLLPALGFASTATPDNSTVGATTNYTIMFTDNSTFGLGVGESITVTFNGGGFTLASTMIASSPDIDGGFAPATPSGQSVTFTRDGTGTQLAQGLDYTLTIGTVTNPTTPGSNFTVEITTNAAGSSAQSTPTFSIIVGPTAKVLIETQAGGGGTEVGTRNFDTDDDGAETFFAVARDQFDNFINNPSVTWTLLGGIGSANTGSGTSTSLTLDAVGQGVLQADDGSGHTDATGAITVTVGALDNIKIVEGASGDGPELDTRTLTTDQALTVHAAGYDADDNYRSDESVTWSVTNSIGTVSPGSGTSTTLDPTTVATGQIVATHASVAADQTGDITVNAGALNYVRINSGASGNTGEVTTNTLTTGGTFTVHASGYDADDNYRSDESVSWSVTGGIGTVAPPTNISTTLTATTPGTGVIQADHASAIDDATGTITVDAGAIDRIEIRNAPNNGGSAVGAVNMTADESITLYAASFDAQDNYLGDVSVTWSAASGNLAPTISGTGASFTFSPTLAPRNGVIRATHGGSSETDDTGTIDVAVGALNSIRINTGATGNTGAVTTHSMTTDQTFTVHASSYDADGNYRDDISVTWSVTGGIGVVGAPGMSTTLIASTVGSGVIIADDGSQHTDATGEITVSAGSLNSIRIVEGSSGDGAAFGSRTISTDQTLTLHAAGYDSDNNYVADQSVTWSVINGIGTVTPGSGTSTTFDATSVNTGRVRATHASAGSDETGDISVTVGVLNSIRINENLSGNTAAVGTNSLVTGQMLTMHTSGYDANGNYRGDVSSSWEISGNIGDLSDNTGNNTTFTATTPGSGTIQATSSGLTDATGSITVSAGNIDRIEIRNAPNNGGSVVNAVNLTADESITLYAASFDGGDNYLGDVTVDWSAASGNLAPAISGTSLSFTFSPTTAPTSGVIRANHNASGQSDVTGTISVAVGALNRVSVFTGASGETAPIPTTNLQTGQQLVVHAAGLDGDDNYIQDESVTWSVTGGIGTLNAGPATSTTLNATTPGSGVIQADHPTATDGTSAQITVTAGNIDRIEIRDAPSNGGNVVNAVNLTADESITLYAASFDAVDTYLGDVSVDWSAASGNLAPAISGTAVSFTFNPTTAPASGVIRANHTPSGETDDTGTISVAVGALNRVSVFTGASGATAALPPTNLQTGQQLVVHAAGLDGDSNYIQDESVTWSVTGGIGTLNAGPATSTTLNATTPGSGVLQADHPTASDGTSALITVTTGSIDSVVVRTQPNNAGTPYADTTLTADETISLYAAGYAQGNYVSDVSAAWVSNGTLSPAVSASGVTNIVFAPTGAPASGKIFADFSGVTDSTGTVTVLPGFASGDVTLTPAPPTLPGDGASQSTITSNPIRDAENNLVGTTALFDIQLIPPSPSLGTIVTPDADAGRSGLQIATDSNSQLVFVFQAGVQGGSQNIVVNSVGGSASGNTTIGIGSLIIEQIENAPDFASRGQNVVGVQMLVSNQSASTVTNISGDLTFSGTGFGPTQRTDSITEIPSQGTARLTFDFPISTGATTGEIVIDGSVNGEIGGSPVSAQGASIKDTTVVQIAAGLQTLNVASPLDTVVQGLSNYDVSVAISNPAAVGGAATVIDSIRLRFLLNGVEDRSADFSFAQLAGNPASVPAGQSRSFDLTVGVRSTAEPGTYQIDAVVTAHDTNSIALALTDNGADVRKNWVVEGAANFQILSLTPFPSNSVFARQAQEWQVKMALQNNGPDAINLSTNVAQTFIRFIIGVDVTNDYTIVQPTQLTNAGDLQLDGNGTIDTLAFRITQTGQQPGTATITGRVQGTDTGSGSQIFDDTNDGGTGFVNVNPQSANISIIQTNAVTVNPAIGGQGNNFVNTGQQFTIDVIVENKLTETVDNVEVRLTTNGGSQIVSNNVIIPSIAPSSGTGTAQFTINTATTPTATFETFSAEILGGIGNPSGNPAPIGPPADPNARVTIQTPASLAVEIDEALRVVQTAGDTFAVAASVENLGQAGVEDSGILQITVPPGYALAQLPGNGAQKSYIIETPVAWDLVAPTFSTTSDTIIVTIQQSLTDINTGVSANIAVTADTAVTRTAETDLTILDFSITEPPGATDGTLSTGQDFDVQVVIDPSSNIDSVQALISQPAGYLLAPGETPKNLVLNAGSKPDSTSWRLIAPTSALVMRTFSVRLRAFSGDSVRVDSTFSDLDASVVARAFLELQDLQASLGSGDQIIIPTGTTFELSTIVRKTGTAGLEDPAEVTLDLGTSGITTSENLSKSVTLSEEFTQIIWSVTSPDFTTGPSFTPISVTISDIPSDENTNETAAHNPEAISKFLQVRTDTAGSVRIDNFTVFSPDGAKDFILSSGQTFTVQARVSAENIQNAAAEITFPAGFSLVVGDPRRIIPGTDFSNFPLQWTFTAPVNATTVPQSMQVTLQGNDLNNPEVVKTAQPAALQFDVVAAANLQLQARITAPQSALDQIVTVGQEFTIQADLLNNGAAGIVGNDNIELILPQSYTTNDPAVQAIQPGQPVTWNVKAPNEPVPLSNITIDMQHASQDENTNLVAPLNPSSVTISVSAEAIGLSVLLLNQDKPTTVVRGASGVKIFGLRFSNSSETELEVQTIRMRMEDKDGNPLDPPDVITRMTADSETASLANSRITFDFGPPLSIASGGSRDLNFFVDVAQETESQNFRFVIPDPPSDIVAINVEADTAVAIRDTSGQTIRTSISPGLSVLIDGSLDASFFNYPNPFGHSAAPTTNFNYNLAQNSDVTIRIYTLLGELVRTFQFGANDPEGSAGIHSGELQWDGTNDKGQKVLNGVYVAVLVTDSGKAMTKIAIAK